MAISRVYLIRHADVENPNHVLYGHLPNFPLSALGRTQALALGSSLADSGVEVIVHSPLERAQETAELVACGIHPHPALVADRELREAEFSRYLQGLKYWQIPIRRPRWWIHQLRPGSIPPSETVKAMADRVMGVVLRQTQANPGRRLALVSHADPLQAVWVVLEGRPQTQRQLYLKPVMRAGMLEVQVEDGQMSLLGYIPPPEVAFPG